MLRYYSRIVNFHESVTLVRPKFVKSDSIDTRAGDWLKFLLLLRGLESKYRPVPVQGLWSVLILSWLLSATRVPGFPLRIAGQTVTFVAIEQWLLFNFFFWTFKHTIILGPYVNLVLKFYSFRQNSGNYCILGVCDAF